MNRHALVLSLTVCNLVWWLLVSCTNAAVIAPPALSLSPTVASAPAQPVLTHGPVVGAVTPTTARVFVRTSAAADVKIRYATTSELAPSSESKPQATRADSDFTAQVNLDQLAPTTTYYLDVLVNGVSQLTVPYPRFKTFPVAGTSVPFRFAALSDFRKTNKKPYIVNTFARVNQNDPAFVIIGGDFDHRGPKLLDRKRQMFKDLYTPANGYEDFVNLILRRFSVAHLWDDHDYGPNNGDSTYADKQMSLQVLSEFFPTYPMSPYGDWQKFSYAQADFFMLDSRSQRDPNSTPDGADKSMLDGDSLGASGQLAWLKDGLLASKATWKFIVSPVVFNPTLRKNDSWFGFKYEHDEIVNFIQEHKMRGVIVISGDVHFGAIDDGTNAGLPEIIVPAANTGGCLTTKRIGTWSVGAYVDQECNGYALIEVNTNPDQVHLVVKDKQGVNKFEYTVNP